MHISNKAMSADGAQVATLPSPKGHGTPMSSSNGRSSWKSRLKPSIGVGNRASTPPSTRSNTCPSPASSPHTTVSERWNPEAPPHAAGTGRTKGLKLVSKGFKKLLPSTPRGSGLAAGPVAVASSMAHPTAVPDLLNTPTHRHAPVCVSSSATAEQPVHNNAFVQLEQQKARTMSPSSNVGSGILLLDEINSSSLHHRHQNDARLDHSRAQLTNATASINLNNKPAPTGLSRQRNASERDGFCRRVDSYDGQTIVVDGIPTYDVGNYLGGGVAGVVYEGVRLRPLKDYPIRTGIGSLDCAENRDCVVNGSVVSRANSLLRGSSSYETSGFGMTGILFDPNLIQSYLCRPDLNSVIMTDVNQNSNIKHSRDVASTQGSVNGGGTMNMDLAFETSTSPDNGAAEVSVMVDSIDSPSRSQRVAWASGTHADGASPPECALSNRRNFSIPCDETVAIKILNPIGFRLLSPTAASTAVVVKEGANIDEQIRSGTKSMEEEHVWWLVNPKSPNLRLLQRRPSTLIVDARDGNAIGTTRANKVQRTDGVSTHDLVDRGSADKGLRLSLVAAYVDPKTNTLRELPLTKCIEIWGHAPFGASEAEFEEMMDSIERVNAGHPPRSLFSMDESTVLLSPPSCNATSAAENTLSNNKQNSGLARATSANRTTVFCAALNAYVAVPAVPPKYLRWLRQRRAATKEIRNMIRIGRHENVVHLYEVMELIQDSKSTMFLVLELVRGGELFDLISSNPTNAVGANGMPLKLAKGEESEFVMLKFFKELASGIAYCHKNGIAHRDLKPENLLVHNGPNGECTLKIADFGLSATFAITQDVNAFEFGDIDRYMCGSFGSPPVSPGGMDETQRNTNVIASRGIPCDGPVTGLSPLVGMSRQFNNIQAMGVSALSFLTCGNIAAVAGCAEPNTEIRDAAPKPLRRMTSIVGSPHYVAPEIICQSDDKGVVEGYDGTKADVWSAGVILYAMLFRSLPFGEDLLRCPRYQSFFKWYNEARKNAGRRSNANAALSPLARDGSNSEDLGPHWFFPSNTTVESKDLIVAMLNPDPYQRLSIEQVLLHPWVTMPQR